MLTLLAVWPSHLRHTENRCGVIWLHTDPCPLLLSFEGQGLLPVWSRELGAWILVQHLEQTWSSGSLCCSEAFCMLFRAGSYPLKPSLFFVPYFLREIGASCGFLEHLTAASPVLQWLVAGFPGCCCSGQVWVFPQQKWHWLRLTSSLSWMKIPELSARREGVGMTSGILTGTPTSPALQHCMVKEGRTHVSWWGQESEAKDLRAGQYQSLACLGTLALIRICTGS